MKGDDPDAELIARVGQGDPAAARLLVQAKLPRILGLARRLLRDHGDAEDVAQEAFVRVWRHAGRWQPGAARFDTWLHTVTLNLCRDRVRRRRPSGEHELGEIIDPSPSPAAMLEDAADARAVERAIGMLPARQREAIILVHYQDLTNIAAAAAMDISVDALESLLARGRRALRATFAALERDHA